jgi:drug/metabolite transporter (DMT)-like permease
MKETLKGSLFIIAAMSLFALMGVFVRLINLPSSVIIFYDFMFTAIILAAFFLFKNKSVLIVKKYFWLIVTLGVVNSFNNFFFFQAFKFTTLSNTVLTHYTAPLFVALFAHLILKERLEKLTVISLIIAMAGLVVISYGNFSFQSGDFRGIAYGTGSGFMYGLTIILIKHLSKFFSVYTINIYMSFVMALVFAPFVFASKTFLISANQAALILLMSLLFGVLASILHMQGIKRMTAQKGGILAYTEPLAATMFGFLFFTEIPSMPTIIGGLLIIYAGYLIMRHQK